MAEPEDSELLQKYHNTDHSSSTGGPVIIAMGVGGGGGNAVDYMCSQDIRGVEFIALNTDLQALRLCHAPTQVLLGPKLCGGLGAGGRPEVGAAAAEESVPEIERLVDRHVDMVFITAGMGGGTGTGAAPVVARVTKERDILTIGIVTIPFFFEGLDKMKSALDGAAELKKNVDALLIINNDRLSDIYPDLEFSVAFAKADDILATASRSISDMVTTPAMINIDMKDVNTTLRDGRTAFISVGYGEGENRMSKAIQNALHSPLLCDTDILSARRLLFAFYYSHDIDPAFRMSEATEANKLVAEMNKRVKVIFGWGYDDTLGNKIKFTILASGFDVTVEHGSGDHVIEGSHTDTEVDADTDDTAVVASVYGPGKVDNLIRTQQTQNYFLLSPEELDSDEAIEMVERNPAYRRDKRKVTSAKAAGDCTASRSADLADLTDQIPEKRSSNHISFNPNDR